MAEHTCEDERAVAGSIAEVRSSGVLLVAGGAAEAAVAAGVAGAAVARDLAAVHAQLLQALLQLLVGHAVLRDACGRACAGQECREFPAACRRAVLTQAWCIIQEPGLIPVVTPRRLQTASSAAV